MEWDIFQKTLDDLKNWTDGAGEKIKLLKLYSLGEPMVVENFIYPHHICNILIFFQKLFIYRFSGIEHFHIYFRFFPLGFLSVLTSMNWTLIGLAM